MLRKHYLHPTTIPMHTNLSKNYRESSSIGLLGGWGEPTVPERWEHPRLSQTCSRAGWATHWRFTRKVCLPSKPAYRTASSLRNQNRGAGGRCRLCCCGIGRPWLATVAVATAIHPRRSSTQPCHQPQREVAARKQWAEMGAALHTRHRKGCISAGAQWMGAGRP